MTTSLRLGSLLLLALLWMTPSWSTVSLYVAPEDLAEQADLIVEGTVTRTASGYDEVTGRLATYVTLAVETVHRGPQDLEQVVLREPGGRHGELIHEVDAVAVYAAGERVLVFLEPGPDGALRTSAMFFGKFSLPDEADAGVAGAVRDLDGQGLILGAPGPLETERFDRSDLAALAHSVARRRTRSRRARGAPIGTPARTWSTVPSEYSRLAWDGIREVPGAGAGLEATGSPRPENLNTRPDRPEIHPQFEPFSSSSPTRWEVSDHGIPVPVHVQPSGNPLGDAAAAVAEITRAMQAWNDVPESRVILLPGDTDYDYTGQHQSSPSAVYTGTNVVLFDDPYGEISNGPGCSGVLAIGGYWRTGTLHSSVNGVSFHRAMQMYVVFNDGLECFLGDPDNLAEVAAHELGHGLGFGHSLASDAIMRANAYGGRGPRLGDDDRDAAHCHYPHELALLSPNGGEVWDAGSFQAIEWSTTAEFGLDVGVVDLEYSTDGGATWHVIAEDTPNDGLYTWLLPQVASEQGRIRVIRRHRADDIPDAYPQACSLDTSDAPLTFTSQGPVAGSVPDGSDGWPLRLERLGDEIRLSWGASCSDDADAHAIYEGSLAALRAGTWDHWPMTCGAGPDLVEYVLPGQGSRYYLVAPLAGAAEGHLGQGSNGQLRPESAAACGVREDPPACDMAGAGAAASQRSSAAGPRPLARPERRGPGTAPGGAPARSSIP